VKWQLVLTRSTWSGYGGSVRSLLYIECGNGDQNVPDALKTPKFNQVIGLNNI